MLPHLLYALTGLFSAFLNVGFARRFLDWKVGLVAAILAIVMILLGFVALASGLILDTVSQGRREVKPPQIWPRHRCPTTPHPARQSGVAAFGRFAGNSAGSPGRPSPTRLR